MKLNYKYEKRAITLSVILKSYLFVTAPSLICKEVTLYDDSNNEE